MYIKVKCVFDVLFAMASLTLLSPVLISIIILLFISNKGQVFFIQQRTGKNGKPFNIIKFKTMNDKTDKNGTLLPDAERLHGIGKLTRKASLDELPQLINVLKGEMSLIGPRPLLMEYFSYIPRSRHGGHATAEKFRGSLQ